ncbi:hypothetical protein OG864_04615 [Streptomyces sp. NBC_00124]|uniref:hypothetical protein n=1 Tax=Streptomyces sp. NBC_00124 TaxID=2975662 RepID=UPI002258FAAC|nr:hypothetical protein [Streptomyces sp. NBC_00124]MCX5357986.1 hypothetical protein [Streptomyces sp. NBC_00124]
MIDLVVEPLDHMNQQGLDLADPDGHAFKRGAGNGALSDGPAAVATFSISQPFGLDFAVKTRAWS